MEEDQDCTSIQGEDVGLSAEELEEQQKAKEKKEKKALSARIYDFKKRLARGMEVIQNREGKKAEELFGLSTPTTNLFVVHNGIGEEIDYKIVREYLFSIGVSHRLTIYPGLSYGFITCESILEAEKIISSCEKIETVDHLAFKELDYGKRIRPTLFLYAKCSLKDISDDKNNDLPNAERTIEAPGVLFQEEYISKDYEELIIKAIDTKEWVKLAKRKVQHYGYEFLYGINAINRESKQDPIPDFLKELLDRMNKDFIKGEQDDLDQLTINDYYPGDGIAPHFDTHSPF